MRSWPGQPEEKVSNVPRQTVQNQSLSSEQLTTPMPPFGQTSHHGNNTPCLGTSCAKPAPEPKACASRPLQPPEAAFSMQPAATSVQPMQPPVPAVQFRGIRPPRPFTASPGHYNAPGRAQPTGLDVPCLKCVRMGKYSPCRHFLAGRCTYDKCRFCHHGPISTNSR